ncbi:MAG: caspase family protein [Burkholderiales bacterium]|nr:caspase family protein [Burkholderiales bacterium]
MASRWVAGRWTAVAALVSVCCACATAPGAGSVPAAVAQPSPATGAPEQAAQATPPSTPTPPAAFTDPVLRIEAGGHVGAVWRIAADPAGRFVVTAGADNTARVWDRASGRLLRVIRPPLVPGFEGYVTAVAVSPDGKTLAMGVLGDTRKDTEQPVFLFDLATGALQRHLRATDDIRGTDDRPSRQLAFSPDGRWLAAALGRLGGLHVWDWRGGGAPLSDIFHGSDSHGLDWSRDGRLVVSSSDGRLRLYRPEVRGSTAALNKLAESFAPDGGIPRAVAFHPDGQQIAVGFLDSSRVAVVDAQRLELLHWPNVRGVPPRRSLTSVAWSRDGRTLVAGGRWGADRSRVRLWPEGGRGEPRDVATAAQTITDVVPLAGGGWLLGSADGGWGVLEGAGQWIPRSDPPALALASVGRGNDVLLLARNGRHVQLTGENSPTVQVFDLDARTLVAGRLSGASEPITAGVPVENWRFQPQPTLQGKPLAMARGDRAYALAIAPGNGSFVLGTDWYLRHYDAPTGALRWSRTVGATARGVNVLREGPQAGKVVAATFTDGTLRWYRLHDGRQLLTLFMHADLKRWVLWTPGGYYDASPGGEDLIGWHVNRGHNEMADFFPASRFRARFHRPDVIDRVLDTLDEAAAVAQADAAMAHRAPPAQAQAAAVGNVLPPVVEVLAGTEVRTAVPQITLRVRGRGAADAPVTGWRVRVNGQAVNEVRSAAVPGSGAAAGAVERDLTLGVPARDSEVQVFAENRHGVSAAATVRVQWAGASTPVPAGQPGPAGESFHVQPKLYVLAVGVGAYAHGGVNKLAFPAKDARDFATALQRQKGRLYRDVQVKVLADAQATRDSVIDGLDWLQRQVTQHDVGVVFIAGHGLNDAELGYAFLPVNTDPERLRSTAVPMDEFKKTLSRLPGKALFFFDTCHSGNVLGPRVHGALGREARSAFGNDVRGVINELSSAENGVVVFSSSTGRQLSYEDNAWGNGAFTKALVEGLGGKADYQKTGRITHKMLDLYVSERVKELTQGKQSPVTQAPGGVPDYPVAWVR